jgi:hypothetical protein
LRPFWGRSDSEVCNPLTSETISTLAASTLASNFKQDLLTHGLHLAGREGASMRIPTITAALLSISLVLPGANLPRTDNNPIRLTQAVKNGTLRVAMKNVSNKPISAYVVAVESEGQSNTHHDFFTGRDAFKPGKTIELVFAIQPTSSTPNVFVDYVRLADNSTWGNEVTDDAKDVAASFQK